MFKLSQEQQFILIGFVISIILGSVITLYRRANLPTVSNQIQIEKSAYSMSSQSITLTIHICGTVKREGVYRVKSGARIMEVLEIAGGTLQNADLSAVNLAEQVKDGQKILIPEKIKFEPKTEPGIKSVSNGNSLIQSKVNLNTADEKTLDSLPGVGPSTARAIVEFRRINGPFSRTDQIMELPKFGKAKFVKIKDKVTL